MAENDYALNNLEDRVDQTETDTEQNSTDISGNDSDIQSNSSDIQSLEQGLIPVAGITAWHKNLTSKSLPDRFKECDGSTVNDSESPLDRQSVPDLNGDNRILKGNNSSGGTGSFKTNGDNTSNTENVFDVVWVMRIK